MTTPAILDALQRAAELAERFEAEHGRPLTPVDIALAAVLLEHGADVPAENSDASEKRTDPEPDTDPAVPLHGDLPTCPECRGPLWDNREKKRAGEFKATSPDMACKDKACSGRIWHLQQKHMLPNSDAPEQPAPATVNPFDDDDGDSLPF